MIQHKLGIVAESRAWSHGNKLYMASTIGRVIEEFARRFREVVVTLPVADGAPSRAGDHQIRASNVEVIPQPFYASSMAALRHPVAIAKAYQEVCRRSDYVFVRGMPPFSGPLYLIARLAGLCPCHWIVGDPVALLKSHRRKNLLKDYGALAYAHFDRICTRVGNRLSGGSFVCNGQPLGDVYPSARTRVTASSTVTDDEFFLREDTCEGSVVRILFVGFLRPEKGVEYLLEAVGRLKLTRPWELVLAGSCELYEDYGQRLEGIAERLGIADRLHWVGHVQGGPDLYNLMHGADLLVLPTLSEGTPHVLIEAMASSLPVVASSVGGIPTFVHDRVNGMLVRPKDPESLARVIEEIVIDGNLRRALIRNGVLAARELTLDRFVDLAISSLGIPNHRS